MSAPPPPPPPTFNVTSAPAGGDQGRNLLLESIRAGKSLKKTVTVDKSAPIISGKARNGSVSSNSSSAGLSSSSPSNSNNTTNSNGPMGLGGLFAGGMPKLKPTGLRGTFVDKDTTPPHSISVAPSPPPSATATMKRGPPPAPPPATQKPQISLPQSATDAPSEPTKGFGKPMLAPKPPVSGTATLQKPCPPPKKPELFGGSVSRAQSMRLPRSPPVLAPTPSSLHQSQDCLVESQQRPNRVLRPPVARPPSPPTSRFNSPASGASAPFTRAAPPPPSRIAVTAPSMPPPPPPPPHRSNLTHQRLAPPPPPTPPTRNLSLSNGQSTINSFVDFETRFGDLFHSSNNFPPPEIFRGVPKLYNSKNAAKQQAPAPPSQSSPTPSGLVQLNASAGGKQWQHNSASSVC